MSAKQTIAGTTAAMNQPPQVMSTLRESFASFVTSGLAAMPVMNMAPVMGVNWKQAMVRKSPIFLPVGPGPEPSTLFIERAMGKMIPPDRAVTEAERAKLLSAIAAQGCSAGKLQWDDDDREFEVDDASCTDGKTYDLKFNPDYTIKSKKLDD